MQMQASGGIALATGSGGGSHGSARGMSGKWHLGVDVDLALREWDDYHGGLTALLNFVYVEGAVEELVETEYLLYGGDVLVLPASKTMQGEEPPRYSAKKERFEITYRYDLRDFIHERLWKASMALSPGSGPEMADEAWCMFLTRLHDDFCGFMAQKLGLGVSAPRKASRRPELHLVEQKEEISANGEGIREVAA